MFLFFLKSYRSGILDFCGSNVVTKLNLNKEDSRICFVKFNNGEYPKEEFLNTGIETKHPNILKGVIVGKKSWGLWLNEWSKGISEGLFRLKDIIEEFDNQEIIIPEKLLDDFKNKIWDNKYKK